MSSGHLCEAEAPTEPAGETRGTSVIGYKKLIRQREKHVAGNFLSYILAEQLFLQCFHNEHRPPLALAEDNCLSPSYSLNSNEFQFTDTYTRSAYCLYDKAKTLISPVFSGSDKAVVLFF